MVTISRRFHGDLKKKQKTKNKQTNKQVFLKHALSLTLK